MQKLHNNGTCRKENNKKRKIIQKQNLQVIIKYLIKMNIFDCCVGCSNKNNEGQSTVSESAIKLALSRKDKVYADKTKFGRNKEQIKLSKVSEHKLKANSYLDQGKRNNHGDSISTLKQIQNKVHRIPQEGIIRKAPINIIQPNARLNYCQRTNQQLKIRCTPLQQFGLAPASRNFHVVETRPTLLQYQPQISYPRSSKTIVNSSEVNFYTEKVIGNQKMFNGGASREHSHICSINTSIKKIEQFDHKDVQSIDDEQDKDRNEQISFVLQGDKKLVLSHLVSTTQRQQGKWNSRQSSPDKIINQCKTSYCN